MAYKATTQIEHGHVDDKGNNVTTVIDPGDKLDESLFTPEEIQTFVDAGVVEEVTAKNKAGGDKGSEEAPK